MGKIFTNWDAVDVKCEHCGNIKEKAKGINRQNMIRLIKPKFDLNEIVMTAILIGIIAIGFLYNHETQACRDWLKPMQTDELTCNTICADKCTQMYSKNPYDFNQTEWPGIDG